MKVGAAQGGDPRAAVHRLDEPTELSLSMVASPQCRFRFARQNYCSAAATSPANFRMPRSSGLIRRSKLFSQPLHGGATRGFLALFRYARNLAHVEPAADL